MSARRLLLCMVVAGLFGSGTARAADPLQGGGKGPAPLQFRRVYVPADRIQDLARGYLPLKQEEFERLVRQLESGTGSQIAGAAVLRAEYSARLDQQQLTAGTARLEIAHQTAEPVGLLLSAGRLAIGSPTWDEPKPRAASLGLAADGKSVLLVDKSGRLTFPWTLRGKGDSFGGVEFDLQLPASPSNRLTLDLPVGLAPVVDLGAVVPNKPRPAMAAPLPADRKLWTLELGGHTRVSLRILSEKSLPKQQQLVLVRKNLAYALSPNGLALSAELRLDAYHEPLRRLALQVESGLHITSARLGDKLLVVSTSATSPQETQVVIDLPEPLLGVDRLIQVTAVGAIPTGEKSPLPSLHVEGAVWQGGSISLAVPDPLVLEDITTTLCRQLKTGSLPAPATGELFQFQAFARDAALAIQIGRRANRLKLLAGTSVTFGAATVSGVSTVDVAVLKGEAFDLMCETTRLWVIDSIETEPAELLDDWSVVATSARQQQLRLRMKKALDPRQGARIIVQAHRQLPPSGKSLNVEQLRLVEFPTVAERRALVLVRAEPPHRLEVSGDGELTRLDPGQLAEADAALFDPNPSGLLFVDNSGAADLQVALESERPRYSSEVAMEVQVDDESLTESYLLRCRPDGSHVARLLVHFSQRRDPELSWVMPDDDESGVSPRRLSEVEQREAGLSGGETWDLVFRRARSTEFEVRAKRTVPLRAKTLLALASLPEAASQSGTLAISATGGASPEIDGRSLEPLPPRGDTLQQYSSLRALFRYEPAGGDEVSIAPPTSQASQPSVFAWNGRLESTYSGGRASQTMRYLLENMGREFVTFSLPVGSDLEQVLVNDAEVPLPSVNEPKRQFVVPLPVGTRFPTVSLTYVSRGIPRQFWGARNIAPVLPTPDFPVLAQFWTLRLPGNTNVLRPGVGLTNSEANLSWSDRLLGPLRPVEGGRPFALLSFDAWRDLTTGASRQDVMLATRARALASLGKSIDSVAGEEAATWQDLLSSYDRVIKESEGEELPTLLVDFTAIAAMGISPDTVVPKVSAPNPAATAEALLAAANLELDAIGSFVVLTSANAPRPLSGDTLSLEAWFAAETLPPAPWKLAPPAPHAELGSAAWNVVTRELPASGQLSLPLYQPRAAQTLAWATLIAVAFLVWQLAHAHPRRLAAAAAAAGLAALFAEGLWVPVATASFLGVALAALLVLAWRVGWRRALSREDASTRTMAAASPVASASLSHILLAILLAACFTALRAFAQEPAAPATDTAAKIHAVYIPVDEKRVPTSGYVYLPQPFFDALYEQVATTSGASRGWLLHSALYQCDLDRDTIGGKLIPSELTATLDLEVLQPRTQIRLPFKREGLHHFGERARLNGREVQVDWSDDGLALVLEIDKPDKYLLELVLQPTVRVTGDTAGFDVSIPRLPRARFKVAAPQAVEGLVSTQALGATTLFAETGEFQFDLGPTNILNLRWPAMPGESGRPVELDGEELLWLKVRPGTVVLEGRFRLSLLEGQLREARIVADPRLRLLPPKSDQPIASYRIQEGEPQSIHFELKPPHAKEVVLHLSFLVSGVSGVGNLVLPRLEATCDRVSRRTLAVSLDPELEAEYSAPVADEGVASEFVRAWGKGSATAPLLPPVAVFRLAREAADWTVSARPRQPQTTGSALLEASFDRTLGRLNFDADLSTTGGSVLQHRLRLPAGLTIESISLRQGALERVARWSRPTGELAVVFLNAPVTGDQQLVVRGSFAAPRRGDWEVPRLALEDAQIATREIRLYRSPEARVRVTTAPRFVVDPEATLGIYREGLGRLAAVLQADPTAKAPPVPKAKPLPLATVAVEENSPRTTCSLATVMLRRAGNWAAEVECRLNIDSGLIDVLRFDVPESWSGPFEVEPAAEVDLMELPGQDRRRLMIRPVTPFSGDTVLRLRGPLTPATRGRVAAPDVMPLALGKVERFLVVPTQIEAQQIAWETSGLQAAPLPLEIRGRFPVTESFAAYQVIGARFQASIKHVERVSGVPQVRLADIHVAWRPDGSCHGVALFDLEPAGLRHCLLELPDSLRLVHVDAAELPALLTRETDTTWRVELGPDQLPQRISVTFRGGVPHEESPPKKLRFAAPHLKNLPVEQTLWTVYEPRDLPGGETVLAGRNDALQQELLRYQTTAGLVERAAGLVSEGSPREMADWYAPWANRLAVSRRALDVLRSQSSATTFAEAEIATLDREQAALATRLSGGPPPGPEERLPAGRARLFDLTRTSSAALHASFAGAENSLDLTYTRHESTDLPLRLAVALGLLSAALLAYWLAARGYLSEILIRWPHLAGVLFGLAWWLWLSPSVLGWLFIAVSVFGAFGSPWRAFRSRPDAHSALSSPTRRR